MPSEQDLAEFARRGAAAQAAVDTMTPHPHPLTSAPARRRGERIHHPELLEPITLPSMREPQVIISMEDYRDYERFVAVFVNVENMIARGRLEARIEAYSMVLNQVELNDTLSAVRQPGLIDGLQRIIAACREDLARLEAEAVEAAPTPIPTIKG